MLEWLIEGNKAQGHRRRNQFFLLGDREGRLFTHLKDFTIWADFYRYMKNLSAGFKAISRHE